MLSIKTQIVQIHNNFAVEHEKFPRNKQTLTYDSTNGGCKVYTKSDYKNY